MKQTEHSHSTDTLNTFLVASALRRFRDGEPIENLGSDTLRPIVQQSWIRCRNVFPLSSHDPVLQRLSKQEFGDRLLMQTKLVKAVQNHLKHLLSSIQELETIVLVCDEEGWLLDMIGAPRHVHRFNDKGVYVGTNVTEQCIGNTSIGTSLALRKPVLFHGVEHFFSEFHNISGAGAPIMLHEDTDPVGALAFITFDSHVNPYLPLLVHSASQAISNHLLLQSYQGDMQRIHRTVVSQMEYHVILTDKDHNVIDQLHPLMLTTEAQRALIQLTKEDEYSDYEISLGNRLYRADVRCLWDETGVFKGKLGLFRDITKSRMLETRVLNAEKFTLLNSLAAGIAHEIRNPLTTARGFLQLFLERLNNEQDRRFLDLTIEELDRIQRLVTDFMKLAKPDKPDFGTVNLSKMLMTLSEFLSPEATLNDVVFETVIPDRDVWGFADENQLKQVILNIFQNAIQACTSRDTVRLELTASDDSVQIIIQDTGCGMNESQVARLFQPYYTTKANGTGLGLVVCQQILTQHQGRLDVTSAVNEGTTVCISLPRLDAGSLEAVATLQR